MRKISWLLALAIPATIISCQKEAVSKTETTSRDGEVVIAGAGNGAPSGYHYSLNIIGVPKGKTADMTGNNGHRIFVNLDGKVTKINLSPSQNDEFQVTDANGTDGVAGFTLPNPDPNATGVTRYSVYARVPGNQKGAATLKTCADGVVIDGVQIEVELPCDYITFDPDNYKKFQNVSAELLYVTLTEDVWTDANNNGVQDPGEVLQAGRYPLFDERLYGYFWEYDANGMHLLQLRFYWIPTEVDNVVPEVN